MAVYVVGRGIVVRYPYIGDPDVITRQGQQFALPTLQPRHCQQRSIWYHRSTNIDHNVDPWPASSTAREANTTDIDSGTRHHYSHRPPPHNRHLQSSKCRLRTSACSRASSSRSAGRAFTTTTERLKALPSTHTDDCLLASTWDYAGNSRMALCSWTARVRASTCLLASSSPNAGRLRPLHG
jgi:hypothetical protein